jgi:hypothetical protein
MNILSNVYARKHSSRRKVKRLVLYVAIWSDWKILNDKVLCMDKKKRK